ncbi:hypothetical protein ACN47E_005683 [Coniothyrium glycines]
MPSNAAAHTPTKYLTEHHKNVLHGDLQSLPQSSSYSTPGPSSQRSLAPSAPLQINSIPLDQYWDATVWCRFLKGCTVSMKAIVACLGLRSHWKQRRCMAFDYVPAAQLSQEIENIAARLYVQLTGEQLVHCAADSTYLDEEVDILLDEFAPQIWGLDCHRTQLLQPGAEELYPKHLVYEEDEDRKLLWLHLHRWTFARAFTFLRQANTHVKQGLIAALQQRMVDADSVVPARNYSPRDPVTTTTPQQIQKRKADSSVKKNGTKKTRTTSSSARHIDRYPEQSRRLIVRLVLDSSRRGPKALDPSTASPPDATSLISAFVAYCHASDSALSSRDSALSAIEAHLPTSLPSGTHADAFNAVLTAFIAYRRAIHAITPSIHTLPAQSSLPLSTKIARSRLLTQMRQARDMFASARRTAECSAADVLTRGFGEMSGATSAAEKRHVADQATTALEALDAELLRTANALGEGGWVVMG